MESSTNQGKQQTLSGVEVCDMKISEPWKVLLVDDDIQMHQVTRLALCDFVFDGRKIDLISAYSAREAEQICQQNSDIALALIDVVMETEHAGLDLIKFIRNQLENRLIRLVLRTGQAGQAPEDIIIREYEIDDYKEKTELTTQKLKTLLYSMLRAYRDLCLIHQQQLALKKVIRASAVVQNSSSLQVYAATALEQLALLLEIDDASLYCIAKPRPEGESARAFTLMATDISIEWYNECYFDKLPAKVIERCQVALDLCQSQRYVDAFVLYIKDEQEVESVLYVSYEKGLTQLDVQVLEIYMQNIGLTFENLNLLLNIKETSKELVYNLANAVEARSRETGAHVQRVSLICEKLAFLYGLSRGEVDILKHASPLHDIGKVAVPDSILHKKGKLTNDEWEVMKKHVDYGVEMLSRSKRSLIVKAKEIAAYHHEKWDGTGYPNGLKGEEIPISGRIAALADVFDALGAKRSYKEPWSDEDIYAEILGEKGRHFEPRLVDLLLEHWQEFINIRNSLPD